MEKNNAKFKQTLKKFILKHCISQPKQSDKYHILSTKIITSQITTIL